MSITEKFRHSDSEDMAYGDGCVVQIAHRNSCFTGDYLCRIVEMRNVVRTKARKRDCVSRFSRTTSNPAGPLGVVCSSRRNISHKDGSQVANVHA